MEFLELGLFTQNLLRHIELPGQSFRIPTCLRINTLNVEKAIPRNLNRWRNDLTLKLDTTQSRDMYFF